jgi:hypothetical protein
VVGFGRLVSDVADRGAGGDELCDSRYQAFQLSNPSGGGRFSYPRAGPQNSTICVASRQSTVICQVTIGRR